MSNQATDLPSSEPQSPSNNASSRETANPLGGMIAVLPSSVTRTLVPETNAVVSRATSSSTSSSTNHVSNRHAGAACSAAAGILCSSTLAASRSRVNASECQIEHTSNNTTESADLKERSASKPQESSSVEAREEKKSEYTVGATDKDTTREEEEKMCIAETSKDQRAADKAPDDSNKKEGSRMYEIPLTILPKDDSAPKSRKKKQAKDSTSGRWTHEEHQAFLEGLKVFGREWKKVADKIPTRTSAQIRSHAQKYFSKLAREEALALHEPAAQAVAQRGETQAVLPQSVQRTAERILANPTGAQREVEDTLRQLRERYRQLQIRLEESQRRPSLDRIVEDGAADNDGVPAGLVHRGGYAPGIERRKRSFEEASAGSLQQHDDGSSVSSDLSASLASLSPTREFGNEELIALHVLGGTLPRSASSTELQGQSRTSSFSEGEDSEAKRQRLADSNDRTEGGEDPERDQDGDETMI